jgi:hypothetical protein
MYYDRRVPKELLDLLLPDGSLGWLVPWLSSAPAAAAAGAHVQTRWARGGRSGGGIQLYLGRTSPLEILGRPRGRLELKADATYRRMSPALFAANLDTAGLATLSTALREHVERAAREAPRSFLGGEAIVHAGLMRHYGPLATEDAPFVALDSEARMGFASKGDRSRLEGQLAERVGIPATEKLPSKLDLVAVDHAGRLLLVEVKVDAAGLHRAAWQAAVHVARFRELLTLDPSWFREKLGGLAADKVRVGLVGRARVPSFEIAPAITPVIAAPDARADWASEWRRQIAPVVEASRRWLDGLRLWRLAADGRVVEDVAA